MLLLALMLTLSCGGGGAAIKDDTKSFESSGTVSGSYDFGRGSYHGEATSNGTISGTRERSYQDQVDLEINEAEGRIRLPRVTLPVAHGGSGGWFVLKDLQVSDRVITAVATVNFINKPKIYIDRVTGLISINGQSGNFVGQCQRIEASTGNKF